MSNIGLGNKVRMSRMVNPVSNKMMAITVDHAISRGIAPMTGLHSIQSTIDKIVAGKPDAMTVTPGIRFADSAAGDQKRIMTPEKAGKSGCDYIVVGRPITQAEDPVSAYRRAVKDFWG